MDEQTRQAILSSNQLQAPTSYSPELQKYYDINFQLPLSSAGVKVLSGQAEAQNAQREFDVKKKVGDIQDKMDGKNFKRVPKADGGFAFFDPNGQEISANDYARATGKSSYEVLADSENPIDIQYARDYENLQDFMDAAMSGDKETMEAYYSENPALRNLRPADVLKKFKEAYPTVYGMKQRGQPVGRTFIPQLQMVRNASQMGGFSQDFGGM